MRYIKSLNALRAIAVLMVIFQHWLPLRHKYRHFDFGATGVDIFFTISGFLITTILLRDIGKYNKHELSFGQVIGHFFIRRLLRIIPAYGLALLLTFLFKGWLQPFDAGAWPYLLTFTFNIYMTWQPYWPGTIPHFWSLAVEEQYYLFWPFLLIFSRPGFRPYLMAFLVILAVILRYHYIQANDMMYNVRTITCLDAFGLGGLLAWFYINKPDVINRFFKPPVMIPSLLLLFFLPVMHFNYPGINFLLRLFTAIFSTAVIAYLLYSDKHGSGSLSWFWNNPLLELVGKISYGMYLYHFLVPELVAGPWVLNFFLKLIILFSFSWLSWKYFELPILTLKKYFH
ncbi:acyltransferase family protein [Flavihumibacter fluvii]|uniref:acyltransferase family protein n=1 Tax=Flavihumibacter fluvii TaxID=2838157 RepID=UPI001BDEC879|nr:acyltransferase [Flavihumibacter fluvii]ULQ52409.1 acyltransferase [Flavihumibacter fluvii]